MRRLLSLAASIAILAAFAVPLQTDSVAAQSTFTYTLNCKGDNTQSSSAWWNWYTQNGALLGSGATFGCSGTNSVSGSQAVPPGANSITASLLVFTFCGIGTDSVTKTFSTGVSISLHAVVSGCRGWLGKVAMGSADFTGSS